MNWLLEIAPCFWCRSNPANFYIWHWRYEDETQITQYPLAKEELTPWEVGQLLGGN